MMLPPNNVSVPQLVRETGIPKDTLYNWRSTHRKAHEGTSSETLATKFSSEEKFAVVLEKAVLNEVELGEYFRRKVLYPEQIHAWKRACSQANASQAVPADRTRANKVCMDSSHKG
jgi:hypothetical protein